MKLLFTLLFALVLPAQDYFLLQVGSQWIYRSSGFAPGQILTLEITGVQTIDGNAYFVLKGFPGGDLLVRLSGSKLLLNRDRTEALWADFSAQSFDSAIDACSPKGSSEPAHYDGPIGSFEEAVAIRYSGGRCADAGLEQEIFLPWIGLVRRTETTIGGPRTYDLIYAKLGGVTYVAEPHLSFSVACNPAARSARITLRNTGVAAPLVFPSGQDFDLVVRDAAGKEVYRWSAGRAFSQVFRQIEFTGEKNWMVSLPALPPGKYVAEASLSTAPKAYAASVAFEIT